RADAEGASRSAAEGASRAGEEGASRAAADAAERLARALDDLDWAAIQTIHAFAASLLRLRPVEVRVDPRFDVADVERQRILLDSVYAEYLASEATPGSARLRA